MREKILSLTKAMIAIKSIAHEPQALADVLDLALSNLAGFTIEHFESRGVKSALVYNTPTRPQKFKILLNCHLDIIPGKADQYQPKLKGDRLYGAGAMDMKANVACAIMAFKEVAQQVNYPLGLQLVTDEEIGGFDGTKYQIEQGVAADFVIATEPTNFDIVNEAKGVLLLEILARGTSAHGAYPWRGENAIWKMTDFLSQLQKEFPIMRQEKWISTLNLSEISTTNRSFNKIPDDCTIQVDIRFLPQDEETVLDRIKQILPGDFQLRVLAQEPAMLTDKNNHYLKLLSQTSESVLGQPINLRKANGTSDARHFARVHCAGIEFGPIGGGIGEDEEWVDVPSLEKYYHILKNYLLRLEDKTPDSQRG